ncbi:hypothetical protein [Vagococcus lutrae]|nr:hypothetical protein [Vagococcus lutrae]NKZ27582.1 hypothetical protein [Vagococcus lutrae]
MMLANKSMTYRIALDTVQQVFMAYDVTDETKVGYGITIEKAIAALKNII